MTRLKLESGCKRSVTLKRLPWLFTLLLVMMGYGGWGQITVDGDPRDWCAVFAGTTTDTNPLKRYIPDPVDATDNIWNGGANADLIQAKWRWQIKKPNDKNNISNAGFYVNTSERRIYFFGDRVSTNGDASIGFWFLKGTVTMNANGTFSGDHQDGDILLVSHFVNGGSVPDYKVYRWDGSTNSLVEFTGAGTCSGTQDDHVKVRVNEGVSYSACTGDVASWTYEPKGNGTTSGVYPPNSFFEGYFDFCLVGASGETGFDACFSTFMVETSNSQSITSAMEDFVLGRLGLQPETQSLSSTPVCAPAMGSFTINGSESGVDYQVSGSGYSQTFTGTGNPINVTGLAAGTYSVTAVQSGGFGCETELGTVDVVINPRPTVTAANGGPVCEGGTITLTASGAGGTFSWVGPNGFSTTTQNPTVSSNATLAMAGTYTVTRTVDGCTSAPATTVVVVNEIPSTTAANGGPICAGSTLTLTASGNSGTFAWTGPNGFTSNLQNPSIPSATTAASGMYSVTRTVNGCTSAAATTTAVVNEIPSTIAANGGPICAGSTLTLTASGNSGTFAWTGPNGFTSNLQNPSILSATTAASGMYSVTRTVNGCTSAAATTTAQVDAAPVGGAVGDLAFTCDDTNSSMGWRFSGSVTLTGYSGTIVKWQWSPDGTEGSWTDIANTTATQSFTDFYGDIFYRAWVSNGVCPAVASDAGHVSGPDCLPRGETHCSYTQGFYGGKGKACDGTSSGIPVITFTNSLLTGGLTVGILGERSVTIPAGAAQALNAIMPGGSTARQLDYDGDVTVGVDYSTYYGSGRINNVLLSQTITLALNVRIGDGSLANFVLPSDGMLMTYPLTTCGGVSTGTASTYTIPPSVLDYLGAGATVSDLLELANYVLANGAPEGGPSASEVNAAVDAINRGWDGCRSTTIPSAPMGSARYMVSAPQIHANKLTATAAPNPFFDKVRFTISTPVDGNVQLEVVNMLGQRVSTVYNGFMKANTTQVVDYNVPSSAPQNLIYIIRSGNEQVTGKLLRANR